MRLTKKISLYFLVTSLVFFLVTSFVITLLTGNAIQNEVDAQLMNITRKAEQELSQGNPVDFPPFVEVTPSIRGKDATVFSDVNIMVQGWDEPEPYRQMTSFVRIGNKTYRIDARVSMAEKQDMLEDLQLLAVVAIFGAFLAFFLVNYFLSGKIFRDFFSTLRKLGSFSLQSEKSMAYERSEIAEFDALNRSVAFLSEKAVSEYMRLKEFTAEVNHEMQTPLAVIRSKVELLLQKEGIDEDTRTKYQVILENLNKAGRINRAILLLNKLENGDLFEKQRISIQSVVNRVTGNNRELATFRGITIETRIDHVEELEMNENLLEIVVQNLLKNAIVHNIPEGVVEVMAKGRVLEVTNSCKPLKDDPEKFFTVFYRDPSSSDSIGLGLTIVKKICDLYGFRVTNSYDGSMYKISVDFSGK